MTINEEAGLLSVDLSLPSVRLSHGKRFGVYFLELYLVFLLEVISKVFNLGG